MRQFQHCSTALVLGVLFAVATCVLGSAGLLVAQEDTEPVPVAPPPEPVAPAAPVATTPLAPTPSYTEQQLAPVPEHFQWLQRDVRSNAALVPLASLLLDPQKRRSQLLLAVTLGEEYSDNFSRTQEDRREEYTTRASLGTLYRFDDGPAFVSLANTLSATYRVESDESHVGFANLALNAGYNLPRLSLGLTESFLRDDETSDEGGETASRARSRKRGTVLRNQVSPQAHYAISPLTAVSASYTNTIAQSDESATNTGSAPSVTTDSTDTDNAISHAFSVGLQHAFSPVLDASARYTYTQTDSKTSVDSRTNEGQLLMAYRFTSATSATMQAFGRMIERSRGGIDSQHYGLLFGVRHVLRPGLAVLVAAGPAFLDREDRKARFFVNWQASLDGAIPIFQSKDTVLTLRTQQSVDDTSTDVDSVGLVLHQSVSMQLHHTVSQQFQGALYANYTRTEPLERVESTSAQQTGTENFWSAGARMTYLVTRLISLSADYRYQRRESNEKKESFDENRVTVSVSGNVPVF